jgi:hypothetical protein
VISGQGMRATNIIACIHSSAGEHENEHNLPGAEVCHLEQKQHAPTTINLRLAAVRRVAFVASDSGLLSLELGTSEGSAPDRSSSRELAHGRPGQATAGGCGSEFAPWQEKLPDFLAC